MGSQTLEILRQGIWASLTGGWFYDPHLDVFSNTFHLYVWLFLLCLPFTIYLYFPPTLFVWLAYCSAIVVLFGTIKCINHALHCVYDTTECLEEPNQNISQQKLESEKKRDSRAKRREQPQNQDFHGIELQVLNDSSGKTDTPPVECSSRNSYIEPNAPNADADSITSDYTREKPNSTIDLKVEIHRKNSSESSEEAAQLNKPIITSINVHEAELVSEHDHEHHYINRIYGKGRSTTKKFSRHASEDSRSRYSKSNNLGKTGSESQIKQTSSMELEQPDEYHYWKSNQSVISKIPHQQLVHPQSLETIRASSKVTNSNDDNNLPLHPQSLETINSKKVILPQNTLKRNQLQLLPYLSCGSEIVHPIAEQSDEQVPNESSGRFNLQDSYSPLLNRRENDDRFVRYIVDTTVDNDSANSRDALLEDSKPTIKRRYSNTSQSSWDLSDNEHQHKDKKQVKLKEGEDSVNTGSIVGIDWLFENGEGEPWTSKILWTSQKSDDTDASDSIQTASTDYLASKEPDSGSSSTTTLSLENEAKRKLLPIEVESKRQQGAIPKQCRSRAAAVFGCNQSSSSSSTAGQANSAAGDPAEGVTSASPVLSPLSPCSSQLEAVQEPSGDGLQLTSRPKKRISTATRERRQRANAAAAAAAAAAATTGLSSVPASVPAANQTDAVNRSSNRVVARHATKQQQQHHQHHHHRHQHHHHHGYHDHNHHQQQQQPLPPPQELELEHERVPQGGGGPSVEISIGGGLLPSPAPPLLAALLNSQSLRSTMNGNIHELQQQPQELRLISRAGNDGRLPRSRYKRLHRSNRTRRRPRATASLSSGHPHSHQQDQEIITLTRFLYHITTNPETPEDSVHYFRDDSGRWLAYTFDEKAAAAAAVAAAAAAANSTSVAAVCQSHGGSSPPVDAQAPVQSSALASLAQASSSGSRPALPSLEHNEKLISNLLRQHLNHQGAHYETNYVLQDSQLPNMSSNSCSSLSLNSAVNVSGSVAAAAAAATGMGLGAGPGAATGAQGAAVAAAVAAVASKAQSALGLSSALGLGLAPSAHQAALAVAASSNDAASSQRLPPFRQLLTDSLADRNRRLQSLLGNFDSANGSSINGSNIDAQGNQIPVLALHQENLSWNRFINEFINFDDPSQLKLKSTRHYYKWKIGSLPHVKIRFDRLSLLALLDRNLTAVETVIATLLAVAVAGLGLLILQRQFYRDIFAFLFCFVTAGCQYSLLKSVQPDAASPTHGFNRIVVFSRPIYFILTASLILILDSSLKGFKGSDFRVYGMQVLDYNILAQIRNVLLIFLLCFPIVFSLGLFPQINTFLMYLCEHIDIHMFGGNATTSLVSSVYCLCRSVITVMTLYGFAYGALVEPKSSQHILFSIFVGMLVAISYHLSRSSSDPSVIWDIVKTNLWPPEVYLEEKQVQQQAIGNSSSRRGKWRLGDESGDTDPARKSNKQQQQRQQQQQHKRNKQQQRQQLHVDQPSSQSKSKASAKKKKDMKIVVGEQMSDSELFDPLPQKLRSTVKARLKNDLIACSIIGILSFGIHSSTVFSALQPEINPVLWAFTGFLGLLLHYILPELRKQLPWLCLARPVLRSFEHSQFEVREPVRIMWFEKIYVYLCFFERNVLYPVVFLGALTEFSPKICRKFGPSLGALIVVVCGLKSLRSAYSDSSTRYLVLVFAVLLFCRDFRELSETFLLDYFVTAIVFAKVHELLLKIRFIVTYIAPWQITWGSAFHAFAQPFSVPHSAMLFLQAAISALLSTPLNPLLGSAIFITSYVRPVKFWERDYKTRRVDHSNTRMSLHLERNLGADDNNLNSIFYEQLTRSLQHSLYGDLALGRWGNVEQGDCFLLASDYLNCLVHVIQLGNGLVTFQLRGLEFRGTYCQQREVEAISEGIEDNDNCCCCEMGHFSHVLSVNAAFSQRWLAWEVASAKYVLEGYSISDNSAGSMLQVFDFRKVLVTYYVKSIIFYAVKSAKLKQWLDNQEIVEALKQTLEKNFVDLDPVFNMNIDEDFDFRASGITRSSFCNVYLDWIQFCATKQDKTLERSRDSCLVSLCLALSLLGRRVLGAASHNTVSSVEFFLYGLHALFKGDFRITSVRDEWVLHDVDLLRSVVAKGVRMALKLHQDHFMSPDTYEEASALYEAIDNHDQNLVISHEADPLWRNAILSGAPSLLALRHVLDDGIDEYKVIMLNKRFLSFRVIKMNRECVRGLWAGQQQELVYLRNRNPERGSIQNAKQALRNIINSSCDQPIGYPIYVSPLTTSYAETNQQLCSITGGPLSLTAIKNNALKLWRRVRRRCGQGCSSGGTGSQDDGGFGNDGVYAMTTYNMHSAYSQSGHNTSGSQSMESGCHVGGVSNVAGRGSLGRGGANTSSAGGNCRGSLASVGKPTSSTLASLAGLLGSGDVKSEPKSETSFSSQPAHPGVKLDKDEVLQRVRIMDPNHVFDAINLGRRIDVIWPDEKMRQMGGRSGWQHWVPERGMEGCVVHRWLPNHRDPNRRSHVDKIILLVKIEDKYVPIAEQGVRDLGAEV